jgi:hypothetical protein
LSAGAQQRCALCNRPAPDLETVLASNETFALRELLIKLHGGEAAYAELIQQNKIDNAGLAMRLWDRLGQFASMCQQPTNVDYDFVQQGEMPTASALPWKPYLACAFTIGSLITAGIWRLPLNESSKTQISVALWTLSGLGCYSVYWGRMLKAQ